jgi:hypothetical protein
VPWQQHPPQRQVQGSDVGSGDSSWDSESSLSACSDEGDAHVDTCSVVSAPESRSFSSTFRIFAGGGDSSPVCGPSEGLGKPDSEPG